MGITHINFSVTGFDGNNNEVALTSFYFNNGQDNVAPFISNLNMPDTLQAGETIRFTVEVSDSNGLNDVEFVFYEAYDPDGNRVVNSQGIYQFPMFDDGNNGDITAGDGIYIGDTDLSNKYTAWYLEISIPGRRSFWRTEQYH